MRPAGQGALAGIAGAAAWAAVEPVLAWALRTRYSDVEYTGRLLTRGRGWVATGLAAHTAAGAAFGAAMATAGVHDTRRSLAVAEIENVLAWPGMALLAAARDGRPSKPRLGDMRTFVQCAITRAVYAVVYAAAHRRITARSR